LAPGAGDSEFLAAWDTVEAHIDAHRPDIILLQCGADGLDGDPLAHLRYSTAPHAHATRRLRFLAEKHSAGRLMAFGGGGYDLGNLAFAWSAVLRELV
jgi:acetoin utilization protein AcuC